MHRCCMSPSATDCASSSEIERPQIRPVAYTATMTFLQEGQKARDVPLFVEHCEAVATEIDVKLRWLGEQARRGLSFLSGALPGRHVALEVACEPSVVGSLWLLPA